MSINDNGRNSDDRQDGLSRDPQEEPGFRYAVDGSTWDIEHGWLDTVVYDPATGEALFRPLLTIAVDRFSGALVGTDIGREGPGAKAAIRCIRKAFSTVGIPRSICVDSGHDFDRTLMYAFLSEFDICLEEPRRFGPERGRIERRLEECKRGLPNA